jgi:Zn-dependent protease with chaperone function
MVLNDQNRAYTSHASAAETPIIVERWPTEMPLFVATAILAGFIWLLLIVSVVGIVYVLFFGLFFAIIKLAMVGQLRGSAVRLGPNQFPELYETVESLARRMGTRMPEVYLMQAGGALNAFAMKFIRANFVVLFSDLLSACGDNKAARNMIIAHELGHLKCGHVRWHWFLLPAAFIPFLASALSRAREYTCDRYGLAGAGDKDGAAFGLTILASGGAHAASVNRTELIRQKETVSRSVLMTLAEWFGSHPPLSKRIAEMDPSLAGNSQSQGVGPALALAFVMGIPIVLSVMVWQFGRSDFVRQIRTAMDSVAVRDTSLAEDKPYVIPPDAAERARAGVMQIAEFVEQERKSGSLPWNLQDVKQRMIARGFRAEFPVDPYDGYDFGYDQRGTDFIVWSGGADQVSWTDDDIRYDSRFGRIVTARADSARTP